MILSDEIHNYYEKLVLQHFSAAKFEEKYSSDVISDLLCIVLNQLPPRYIRHEVDMAFYLSSSERLEMDNNVATAINMAISSVKEHPTT